MRIKLDVKLDVKLRVDVRMRRMSNWDSSWHMNVRIKQNVKRECQTGHYRESAVNVKLDTGPRSGGRKAQSQCAHKCHQPPPQARTLRAHSRAKTRTHLQRARVCTFWWATPTI